MINTIRSFNEMIITTKSLFKNKNYFEKGYFPEDLKNLPHRTKEINFLMQRVVDALKGYVPGNVILYGKTGTGKSTVTKAVMAQLIKEAKEMNLKVDVSYINCEYAKTGVAILKQLNQQIANRINLLGERNKVENSLLAHYREFRRLAKEYDGIIILILDEINKLKDKDFLSLISRIKETGELDKNICMIGITNDLFFRDTLDARTKSSLGEWQFLFAPYNANQLRDILQKRADIGLTTGVLEEEVIPLCAAYAAQEHGDARKALETLKVSVEIAEESKYTKVTEDHVKKARVVIEETMILEAVNTLPLQSKVLLAACVILDQPTKETSSSEIYNLYRILSKQVGIEILTDRRARDLLSEIDLMGLLHINIIYKGRYGRGKEISLRVPAFKIKGYLVNEERLNNINWNSKNQEQFK